MICERDDCGSGCEIRIFEVLPMSATNEKLETPSGKVRSLPKERQEAAIDALADIASQPYELSAGELAVLKPALDRAGRREWASDDEVRGLLDKAWR
jgi:hypothetical protein